MPVSTKGAHKGTRVKVFQGGVEEVCMPMSALYVTPAIWYRASRALMALRAFPGWLPWVLLNCLAFRVIKSKSLARCALSEEKDFIF